MDEIVRELSSLYSEADELIDAYIERVCQDADIPEDIVRHHARKTLGSRHHELRSGGRWRLFEGGRPATLDAAKSDG
jgi:hypothetical protein